MPPGRRIRPCRRAQRSGARRRRVLARRARRLPAGIYSGHNRPLHRKRRGRRRAGPGPLDMAAAQRYVRRRQRDGRPAFCVPRSARRQRGRPGLCGHGIPPPGRRRRRRGDPARGRRGRRRKPRPAAPGHARLARQPRRHPHHTARVRGQCILARRERDVRRGAEHHHTGRLWRGRDRDGRARAAPLDRPSGRRRLHGARRLARPPPRVHVHGGSGRDGRALGLRRPGRPVAGRRGGYGGNGRRSSPRVACAARPGRARLALAFFAHHNRRIGAGGRGGSRRKAHSSRDPHAAHHDVQRVAGDRGDGRAGPRRQDLHQRHGGGHCAGRPYERLLARRRGPGRGPQRDHRPCHKCRRRGIPPLSCDNHIPRHDSAPRSDHTQRGRRGRAVARACSSGNGRAGRARRGVRQRHAGGQLDHTLADRPVAHTGRARARRQLRRCKDARRPGQPVRPRRGRDRRPRRAGADDDA